MDIKIKNLSKSFHFNAVYKNFYLDIQSGEKIGLFGPNGCGKTTLLKIISGIMSYDEGEINIDGQMLNTDSQRLRRCTFYLGHSIGLYKNLTAKENLMFISNIYNNKQLDINSILQMAGLVSVTNNLIKFFSKGMLQRLKLAACMASKSKILLLDEPLSGLDEDGIKFFISLYKKWIKSKKTILLVSHDKKWLKNKTDRIYKLN